MFIDKFVCLACVCDSHQRHLVIFFYEHQQIFKMNSICNMHVFMGLVWGSLLAGCAPDETFPLPPRSLFAPKRDLCFI